MELIAKDYEKIDDNRIKNWIKYGFSEPEDMKSLELLGAFMADKYFNRKKKYYENGKNEVSSSQIIIAYGEMTRIKMKKPLDRTQINILKPKLAYATARNNNKKTYLELQRVLSIGIDTVLESEKQSTEEKKRFSNLYNLFQAIIAYHKVNGGD